MSNIFRDFWNNVVGPPKEEAPAATPTPAPAAPNDAMANLTLGAEIVGGAIGLGALATGIAALAGAFGGEKKPEPAPASPPAPPTQAPKLRPLPPSLVAAGGGNYDAAGNLVAAGAGNYDAQGNLVAAGGGNYDAAGNIVAAGAGNIVAAGAGNLKDKGITNDGKGG